MAANTTTTNGTLTPRPADTNTTISTTSAAPLPAPAPDPALTTHNTISQKRKREDDDPDYAKQQNHHHQMAPASFEQLQRDWLVILREHDLSPSFLKHEVHDDRAADPSEPSQKKARLSEPSVKTSIFAKLTNAAYKSAAELRGDAARVSKDIAALLRSKEESMDGRMGGRLTVDDLKQIQRAKAYAEFITDVMERDTQYQGEHVALSTAGKKEVNGIGSAQAKPSKMASSSNVGTVLTLFGNAPTPKQLFSSMQKHADNEDTIIKTELPVEEMSLPNGLTATRIMPVATSDEKKGLTFEEVFAPPYNLAPLHPPKTHKRSSTRDNTVINWEFKDTISRGSRKGGYTVQQLTGGDWLGYGGLDPVLDAASSREKRKQRDRALSSGGESVKEQAVKGNPEDFMAREEEALFRRAYSSFAPSHDDAKALLPAETKSMIWWQKVGGKRFNETLAIDPALLDEQPIEPASAPQASVMEEAEADDLAEVVSELEQLDEEATEIEDAREKTDVDKVLHKISDLLETLASHQRIRNASIASSVSTSRTPISPAPMLASKIGKPDEPADDEVTTYESLQRELAYLVLKLPPYAVAKLDGDQLADLGVSKMIHLEIQDVKGTMEEDQVARLAKYNAMATAAGISTLTRGTSSSSGQHYSQTSQRTPAIGQAANTRYGQTAQMGAVRTPATQPPFQRSTSNQSQYSTPSATAPRPTYSHSSNFNRATPQQLYAVASGQQQHYQQRVQPIPAAYGTATFNQSYSQQTPQAQQRPAYPSSQPLAQFQQRAANAAAYQSNIGTPAVATSSFNRTASPTKPAPASMQQPRPNYQYPQSNSGRATPNYPLSQTQTPVNGYQQRPPPQPIASRAASGTPQPPPALAPLPPQAVMQSSGQQGQVNGHV